MIVPHAPQWRRLLAYVGMPLLVLFLYDLAIVLLFQVVGWKWISLTSTPKSLPAVPPQIITVEAAPAPTTTTTAATGGSTGAASDAGGTNTDAATAARQGSLLERSRGLLSTVLTGFDGILSNTDTPARKSLLGE